MGVVVTGLVVWLRRLIVTFSIPETFICNSRASAISIWAARLAHSFSSSGIVASHQQCGHWSFFFPICNVFCSICQLRKSIWINVWWLWAKWARGQRDEKRKRKKKNPKERTKKWDDKRTVCSTCLIKWVKWQRGENSPLPLTSSSSSSSGKKASRAARGEEGEESGPFGIYSGISRWIEGFIGKPLNWQTTTTTGAKMREGMCLDFMFIPIVFALQCRESHHQEEPEITFECSWI